MNELTDLEICKRIAEIAGYKTSITDNIKGIWASIYKNDCYNWFNPLTDDALCFQLMIKYDINLTSMEPTLKDGSGGYEYTCYRQGAYQNVSAILSISESPNKAICLAIIEANRYRGL